MMKEKNKENNHKKCDFQDRLIDYAASVMSSFDWKW